MVFRTTNTLVLILTDNIAKRATFLQLTHFLRGGGDHILLTL